METRQRRSFADDYKRQAVDLVASSGRSVGAVAKELGLRDAVLRRWVTAVDGGLAICNLLAVLCSEVRLAGWPRLRPTFFACH